MTPPGERIKPPDAQERIEKKRRDLLSSFHRYLIWTDDTIHALQKLLDEGGIEDAEVEDQIDNLRGYAMTVQSLYWSIRMLDELK